MIITLISSWLLKTWRVLQTESLCKVLLSPHKKRGHQWRQTRAVKASASDGWINVRWSTSRLTFKWWLLCWCENLQCHCHPTLAPVSPLNWIEWRGVGWIRNKISVLTVTGVYTSLSFVDRCEKSLFHTCRLCSYAMGLYIFAETTKTWCVVATMFWMRQLVSHLT